MTRRIPLDTSFVRIASDWTAKDTLSVLNSVPTAKRAIIQHENPGGQASFYEFDLQELLDRLKGKPEIQLGELLKLDMRPSLRIFTHEDAVYPHALVMKDGLIRGVLRAAASGPDLQRRGAGESATVAAAAAPVEPRGLHAAAPTQSSVGEEFEFLAWISKDVSALGTLPIMVSPGDRVAIVLQAMPPLSIHGSAEGEIIVGEEEETAKLRFKISGASVGEGRVTAYAFKDGRALGYVRLAVAVVAEAADTSPRRGTRPMEDALLALPDLSLFVWEDRIARSYTMHLHATDADVGLNMCKFGPIFLQQDPEAFFRDFYTDIESILGSPALPRDKIVQLGAKGTYLFEKVVPEPLRSHLWRLRGRIRSVQIQSEEPWIPWELVKLFGKEGDRTKEADFLCEEFEVTRWLMGKAQHAALPMKAIGLVVPPDSGLPAAPAERDNVAALAGAGRTVTAIAAKATDLRKALADAKYDVLHFTGHGKAAPGNADRSAIALEGGQKFSPEDLTGVVANLGRTHPFVFLNACEVGRAGTGLVGMAGWARGFLDAGAGGFIGPYWKVSDDGAALFARTFYEEFLDGRKTVGAAVRAARAAIKKPGDPTWLAYTAYAHPDAKVA